MLGCISMKVIAALMLAAQLSSTCATTAPSASASANVYTLDGIYCVDEVYTSDGNHWDYDILDYVGDVPTYDGMPVTVWMSDNGTPDDMTDDIVLGLVSPSSNT